MSDRLEAIKIRAKLDTDVVWDTQACANDRDWLITEVERLQTALNPRLWTREHDAAWHKNIPDVHAAFEALRTIQK